jgi:hypothetical protein
MCSLSRLSKRRGVGWRRGCVWSMEQVTLNVHCVGEPWGKASLLNYCRAAHGGQRRALGHVTSLSLFDLSHHFPLHFFRADVLSVISPFPGPFPCFVLAASPSRRVALPLHLFDPASHVFPHRSFHHDTFSSNRFVESNYDNTKLNSQCAKRDLPCQYPLTSRRGQRKPLDSAADTDGVLGSLSTSGTTTPTGTVGNISKARPRASSKLLPHPCSATCERCELPHYNCIRIACPGV